MINIPIFLSADNNYAPFVATTMASILDNTKSFCEFYILDGGITEENQEKICELKQQFDNFSIEFLKLDLEEYFKDFKVTERITKSMYSRFLIPHLKPEIDKAIYSDVDVIFLDDVKKMFEEDLEHYAIGGVWEEYAHNLVNNERKQRLDLSDKHKYFSSGNLLFNCKKWRDNNILKKLSEIAFTIQLREPDMDVLNKYFDNNYKILNPKYCWINQNYDFYGQPKEPIVIRHFNGPIKPWQINPDSDENSKLNFTIDKNKFWKYAEMTLFYDEILNRVEFKTTADFKKYIVYALMKEKAKNS